MKKNILIIVFLSIISSGKAQKFSHQIIDRDKFGDPKSIIPVKTGLLFYEIESNKKSFFGRNSLNNLMISVVVHKLDSGFRTLNSNKLFEGKRKFLPGMFDIL